MAEGLLHKNAKLLVADSVRRAISGGRPAVTLACPRCPNVGPAKFKRPVISLRVEKKVAKGLKPDITLLDSLDAPLAGIEIVVINDLKRIPAAAYKKLGIPVFKYRPKSLSEVRNTSHVILETDRTYWICPDCRQRVDSNRAIAGELVSSLDSTDSRRINLMIWDFLEERGYYRSRHLEAAQANVREQSERLLECNFMQSKREPTVFRLEIESGELEVDFSGSWDDPISQNPWGKLRVLNLSQGDQEFVKVTARQELMKRGVLVSLSTNERYVPMPH